MVCDPRGYRWTVLTKRGLKKRVCLSRNRWYGKFGNCHSPSFGLLRRCQVAPFPNRQAEPSVHTWKPCRPSSDGAPRTCKINHCPNTIDHQQTRKNHQQQTIAIHTGARQLISLRRLNSDIPPCLDPPSLFPFTFIPSRAPGNHSTMP